MKNTSFILAYCFLIVCAIFGFCSNLTCAAPPPLVATTCEATDVTSSSSTLNGNVISYFFEPLTITVWFEYGTTRDNYSGTSSTQNVTGTSETTGSAIPVSIGISGLSPDTTYYYRIVTQIVNPGGVIVGGSTGREKSFATLSATATPVAIVTPSPHPTNNCSCIIPGKVIDALTKKGIKGAMITEASAGLGISFTNADGSYLWFDPEEVWCCGGAYTLTASADGYKSLSQLIDIEPCIPRTLDFELQPISATPTPIVSPTELPDVITDDATNVTSSSATLHGRILKYVTIGAKWFEYCTVSGALDRTVATYGSGESETYDMVSADINGLSPVTTYYYRIVGQYKDHNTYGDEKSFITLAATPAVTPTPLCEAESIEAFPKMLKLRREESGDVTVAVAGSEGCPVVGETVTAKIKTGKRRISVTPLSQNTDASGEAIFTITATKKTGNARVKFEAASGLKTTVTVKVRRE
ncbi:MAG: hypothetical protein E3K36_13700 [Candidatus Brocadia sp.]|nr:hypothetical protein [Candidatus Brocadia sp.]